MEWYDGTGTTAWKATYGTALPPPHPDASEQYRMRNVNFFSDNAEVQLRLLDPDATDAEIMQAAGATLRLGNQKYG